jgi:hypothetical protein
VHTIATVEGRETGHERHSMNLRNYFENTKGVGVLATADADRKVNAAVYARPHFLDPEDDESLAFIMNERLSCGR